MERFTRGRIFITGGTVFRLLPLNHSRRQRPLEADAQAVVLT
jgi:hypothetical protein